jgi:quinol monooxygenase YgiN
LASTEDENVLLMFEKWESKEALDTHMQTEHFKAFGAAIEDLVAKELEITIFSAEEV